MSDHATTCLPGCDGWPCTCHCHDDPSTTSTTTGTTTEGENPA